MYTTEQVLELLSRKKEELLKAYPISALGLFGSYARGDFSVQSDIDVLIDFDRPVDGFDFVRIAHDLQDTFSQPIDLVSKKGIKAAYWPFVEKSLIYV